jgi:CDP-diacylglycerol--serine O-phosphatidyltransferase
LEGGAMQTSKTGIYWLPNLLTTTALFCGFYAIIAGVNGHYEQGAIAIFVAMVFDFLDGRVARMTNATSEFGAEYDSLSDMVSFGVAPAMLVYSWGLQNLGKFGWVAAFIFVAAAALRLARFNTQVGIADKRYFQGLPSPAAAGILAAFVWAVGEGSIGQFTMLIALLLTISAGVLMVSNFRYHSFKEFKLKDRVPFVTLILIVGISVVILIDPATMLLFALLGYAVSGLVITLWGLKERRASRAKSKISSAAVEPSLTANEEKSS